MLESFVRLLMHPAGSERPTDGRGRRLVAVIDCVLNQNVRDAGSASSAGMTWDVVTLCHEFRVGLLQMPCPELACLGLDRARGPGQSIRQAMESDASRRVCATLGAEVADRIEAHVRAGHQVLAVLGGNLQSPGCAVHDAATGLLRSSGVLMRELQAELRRRGLEIPFRAMRDADAGLLAEDLRWLRGVLSASEPV